jgi:DNA ligase 1
VRGEDGVEFNIGTGFDAATRQTIWDNREAYLGRLVKFKSMTHGTKDRPRHPVFIGWRHEDDLG